MTPTDAQHAYLTSHVWGLLATARGSGAPQLSMVAYDWDGSDVVISCRSGAAKYLNARRRSDVAFAVPDGLDNLTITGTAVCHDTGETRDRLTQRLRNRLADGHDWASSMLHRDIAAGLDDVNRVIIEVVPSAIDLIQPQG